MSALLVMDHTGHSTHEFDPRNDASVKEAMEKFRALIGDGYIAAERTGPGTQRLVRTFDPNRTETLLHRHLVGG
jgi:hypothetical protein